MSFFKNVSFGKSRDTLLKESLINNLSECVKDIQYTNQFEENFHSVLGSTDSTTTLCMALEAIFLHGLRDTFLKKARNALSGDPDYRPQPSFWPLILVLSHRQNIDQISSLPQINTEIGQCRAWLRIALNELLLSSYMSTLLSNISAIKPFYNRSAFVCDSEILDVAQRLIEGLESCVQFNLPTNSSILNQWPEHVLILAGVSVTAMRSAPIGEGVDIASTITDDIQPKLTSTPTHNVEITGLGHMLSLNEDEALNFILSKDSHTLIQETRKIKNDDALIGDTTEKASFSGKADASDSEDAQSPQDDDDVIPPSDIVVTGNCLAHKGWSTSNSSHGSSLIKTPECKSLSSLEDQSSTLGGSYVNTPNMRELLNDINKELKLNSDDDPVDFVEPSTDQTEDQVNDPILQNMETPVKKPNLRDIMNDIHKELKLNMDEPTVSQVSTKTLTQDNLQEDDPMLLGLGFEVVSNALTCSFTMPELQSLIKQLGILSREYGLDHQNYQCRGCQDQLGSTVSKAKVCCYTGEYFCGNCMDPNVFIIPARVLHNWDFKRYPVSTKAARFLLEFQHNPWIDMNKINPKIYCGVSDMATLQELRIQLNYLRAYIFTCREPVIEELQKKVWPREYLYEHIHIYTISDLAQIPNGSLVLQLDKVVNFARSHVLDCWLCSQKGFICEVCKDPKILYPFNTATTYRCDECASVFHSQCLNASLPCPKCKRKQNRSNNPSLVEALHKSFQK